MRSTDRNIFYTNISGTSGKSYTIDYALRDGTGPCNFFYLLT